MALADVQEYLKLLPLVTQTPPTRNAGLMRMMEDWHIVENRGSGIKAMLQAMRG